MTRFPRIRRALGRKPSAPVTIAIIFAAALLGTILRLAITNIAPTLLYVSYYPMVLICTLLAGTRAGTICALVSGLLAVELFSPFHGAEIFGSTEAVGGLLAFLVSCAVIILTASSLRRTVSELDEEVRRGDRLNQELQHRVGNTLAVVQAMARQSAKGRTMDEFLPQFEERMQALSRASRYLGTGSELVGHVDILIGEGCGPFLEGGNITITGQLTWVIPTDSCVPLVMAIHELCTNAMKHGALSTREGRVEITCILIDGTDKLLIAWRETGGPPVKKPSRKGLGTALLRPQKGLADVRQRFNPEGLHCDILIEGAKPAR